jgi:thiamine transport system substrate-binding protein
MYPANPLAAGLPDEFGTLISIENALLLPQDEAGALREKAVEEWQAALTK